MTSWSFTGNTTRDGVWRSTYPKPLSNHLQRSQDDGFERALSHPSGQVELCPSSGGTWTFWQGGGLNMITPPVFQLSWASIGSVITSSWYKGSKGIFLEGRGGDGYLFGYKIWASFEPPPPSWKCSCILPPWEPKVIRFNKNLPNLLGFVYLPWKTADQTLKWSRYLTKMANIHLAFWLFSSQAISNGYSLDR